MNKSHEQLKIFFTADEKRLDFLEPLLQVYIDQLNVSLENLIIAQQKNNFKMFSLLIHKIKGSALTYGAKPIVDEIIVLEKLGCTENIVSMDLSELLGAIAFLNKIYPLAFL